MTEDIIIAGFGGQGVLRLGQMLAYSGLEEGKNVLWMPAYGPETRGGFANCTVIVSDEEIGSPIISRPRSVIVLNLPSLDKFEDAVQPGGVLVINTSLVNRDARRTDISVVKVNATEIATHKGDQRAANMVALGAFLGKNPLVKRDSVVKIIQKIFGSKPHVVQVNIEALDDGYKAAREQIAATA
jgi:2-oxoglutarate ferredoxin oxidoreductase subunit gamma